MPFRWKRKTNRKEIPVEVIKIAVKEVESSGKLRETAKKHGIDKQTLSRYVARAAKVQAENDTVSYGPNRKSSQVFTDEQESYLQEYLIQASNMHYGLSVAEIRKLAYQYALAIGAKGKIVAKWGEKKVAGYEWYLGFKARHQALSLRSPEPTSLSRSTSFIRKDISEFFCNIETVLKREKFEPHQIWNIDETSVNTVHKLPKIFAEEGYLQAGKTTSAIRGGFVTVCCAINATGKSIPPFFIFPRMNFKFHMLDGSPPGSSGAAHTSGRMTSENFVTYLDHFIKFAGCSPKNKVLLVMDNHDSHITIESLQRAKDNGIVLVTIPPNTSHKLQPLYKSVYISFKAFYNMAADAWLLTNPGKTTSIYEIAALVGIAYPFSFISKNITSGFAETGISPFNPNILTDQDLLCSDVADRPNPVSESEAVAVSNPGPSTSSQQKEDLPSSSGNGSSFNELDELTLADVCPFSKAPPRKKPVGRKPASSRVLTRTSMKKSTAK